MANNVSYKKALKILAMDVKEIDAFKKSEILAKLFNKDKENTMDDIIKSR